MPKNSILIVVALFVLLSQPTLIRADYFNDTFVSYNHAINLTVLNWTYTNDVAGNVFKVAGTQYALVTLNVSGDPTQFDILGYDAFGQPITPNAAVQFSVVSTNKKQSTILISRTTTDGKRWFSLKIFYGAVDNQYHATDVCMPNPSQTNCPVIQINTTQGSSNFTKQLGGGLFNGQAVLLSNTSLSSENFSIVFYPDAFHSWRLTNTSGSGRYLLNATILGSQHLTDPAFSSMNANSIFPVGDGLGFESYFSFASNQVIGEGFYVNQSAGKAYNLSSNSVSSYIHINFHSGQLVFGINSVNSINIRILPPFTTNITCDAGACISSAGATNPHPHANATCGNIGWYCGFTTAIPIYNISWSYYFQTKAFPVHFFGNPVLPSYNFSFGQSSVGFIRMVFPRSWIDTCSDIYLDYVNLSTSGPNAGFEGGSVPFYATCNSTAVTVLALNHTQNGFFLNSQNPGTLYLFTGAPGYSGTSNLSVYRSWFIDKGSVMNIPYSGNVPFLLNVSSQLNSNSIIGVSGIANPSGVWFGYNVWQFIQRYRIGGGANHAVANALDYSFTKDRLYLVNQTGGGAITEVFANHYGTIVNASTTYTSVSNDSINNADLGPFPITPAMNVILQAPITAQAYRLFTGNFVYGAALRWTPGFHTCNGIICNQTPLPYQTTTVNPSVINTAFLVALNFTNFQVPFVIVSVLGFIALLVLAMTTQKDDIVVPIIGICALWLLGIFVWPLEILAGLLTLMLLVQEFVLRKKR